jgi:CelD/BcsL family acetyltransferase involved in cellulose biosynthesis
VSGDLGIEVLESWPAFDALEGEWNDLLGRSAADSIFLTWEWIRAWAEATEAAAPVAVIARDPAGRLQAAAAFYRTELRLLRLLRFRTLRVMGDHPTGAEYPDWLVARGREAELAAALATALARPAVAWDCLWMPRVCGWNGSRERLRDACRAAGLYWHERPSAFSTVPLPARMDEYVRSLSRENRRDLRRHREKILSRPGVEVVRCQRREDVPAFLEALFALHERRWKEKGDPGAFQRHPAQARFYRRFAPVAFDRGWLRIHGLREGGEFKAAQIGYAYGGIYAALQDGFDPSYLPGAGNVLRAEVLAACIAEGLREYDFLGGLNDYKRRWLAQPRTGYDVFVGRTGLQNALLFAREVWPTGRYLRFHPRPAPAA